MTADSNNVMITQHGTCFIARDQRFVRRSLELGPRSGPGARGSASGKIKRQRDGICGGACGGVILGRRFSWLGLGSGVFCLTEVFGVSD